MNSAEYSLSQQITHIDTEIRSLQQVAKDVPSKFHAATRAIRGLEETQRQLVKTRFGIK